MKRIADMLEPESLPDFESMVDFFIGPQYHKEPPEAVLEVVDEKKNRKLLWQKISSFLSGIDRCQKP
jgi:hypothetical protein